jgi:hypothetical protein
MADNQESVLTGSNDSGKTGFKNRKPRFFVTKAGLVGVRGITGSKPLVLYKDQWDTISRLIESGHLENFIEKNGEGIKIRTFKKNENNDDNEVQIEA